MVAKGNDYSSRQIEAPQAGGAVDLRQQHMLQATIS
jgi:hypothetical protein